MWLQSERKKPQKAQEAHNNQLFCASCALCGSFPLRFCFGLTSFFLLFAAAAQAQEPAAPLTLERVISTYIDRNLELQAGRYRLERTKADQIAARLRPNPGMTVTAENFVFTGPTPFS